MIGMLQLPPSRIKLTAIDMEDAKLRLAQRRAAQSVRLPLQNVVRIKPGPARSQSSAVVHVNSGHYTPESATSDSANEDSFLNRLMCGQAENHNLIVGQTGVSLPTSPSRHHFGFSGLRPTQPQALGSLTSRSILLDGPPHDGANDSVAGRREYIGGTFTGRSITEGQPCDRFMLEIRQDPVLPYQQVRTGTYITHSI